MKAFFHSRFIYIVLAFLMIIVVVFMAREVTSRNNVELIITTVESGTVRELVSVSGIAKAKQTAELAFPVTGIVESVFVKTGDVVKQGDPLITLNSGALYADRQDALASLTGIIANRNELLKGPTETARTISSETVLSNEEALLNTKVNENQKVANAYKLLLSSGLTAYSNNINEDAVAPVISGTYNCEEEGSYQIEVFASSASSDYSFRLFGLETGTYQAGVERPGPLGKCGLEVQFDDDSSYSYSKWIVEIPNYKSPLYVTNRNAYLLAKTQAESIISLAEKSLTLSKATEVNQNAPARSEAVIRANAAIEQAQAKLARVETTITDRALTAPFDGTITEIDILPGETVTPTPVVTLLEDSEFEVIARIPEIDIGQSRIGQKVNMVFDAKNDEIITGEISFISLKSTEIDGVAYYEAVIQLDNIPAWFRSGLNADIEIVVDEKSDVLRIPKRFVTKTENGYEVLTQKNGLISSITIEVLLDGNDGYIAFTGLNEGDIVVAP